MVKTNNSSLLLSILKGIDLYEITYRNDPFLTVAKASLPDRTLLAHFIRKEVCAHLEHHFFACVTEHNAEHWVIELWDCINKEM